MDKVGRGSLKEETYLGLQLRFLAPQQKQPLNGFYYVYNNKKHLTNELERFSDRPDAVLRGTWFLWCLGGSTVC